MLKRVDFLLQDARVLASATDFGTNYGIQNDFLLIQLTNAKYELQKAITATQAECFAGYKEYTCAGATSYSMPSDAFANNLLYMVEYSPTGLSTDYYELDLNYVRPPGKSGTPSYYMLDADIIYPDYAPSSGKLRLRYEKTLYNLDIRRGVVSTYVAVGDNIQSITLYDAGNPVPDDTKLAAAEYVCISDRNGNMTIRNVPVDSYDATYKRITVVSGWLADTGWSMPSPAYVTCGADTITHPQGPLMFEQYYVEYMRWEIEKSRGSMDAEDANKKLDSILASIVEIYDHLPAGRTLVPEIRRG